MLNKLLTASALTLMLAGGAYAQATTGSTTSQSGETSPNTVDALSPDQQELFERWRFGHLQAPFFTDDTMMTFRTAEEIRTGFAGLSAEQQAVVRQDCRFVASGTRSYSASLIEFCEDIGAL